MSLFMYVNDEIQIKYVKTKRTEQMFIPRNLTPSRQARYIYVMCPLGFDGCAYRFEEVLYEKYHYLDSRLILYCSGASVLVYITRIIDIN